ncbi:MAG: hypothetical protein M0Z83_03445 [Betaproteobacteria bacterium]|nr:hypothetical protein [Betaproteobacteria bacterium]
MSAVFDPQFGIYFHAMEIEGGVIGLQPNLLLAQITELTGMTNYRPE